MRESSFEDYVILHARGVEPCSSLEPFMGLDPDGFYGESSLSEPYCRRVNGEDE